MSAESATQRGREAIERLMIDECLIRRRSIGVFSDEDGRDQYTWTTIYEGPCRVQTQIPDVLEDVPRAGERQWTLHRLVVQLPIDVIEVQASDVVMITDSVLDEGLIGRQFRVGSFGAKTHLTSRRLRCEEVLG